MLFIQEGGSNLKQSFSLHNSVPLHSSINEDTVLICSFLKLEQKNISLKLSAKKPTQGSIP